MARDSGKLYPFPSDLVDPKVKEDKEKYGLPLARAIYYNNRQQGSSLFYNDRRLHKYYIDYALGEQDVEKYKPFLGINSNNIKQSMLSSVRWNIRNYATKRINALVSRVSSQEYDPVVEAIDQMAIDIKADYKARLQQFIKEKDWVNQLGDMIGMDLTPFGLNIEEVPENDEEIDVHLQTSVKLRSEMELEEGITLHLDRNNYEQKRRQLIFDLFVIGVAALWTGVDGYGNPVIKRISPQDMIVPYSEIPDFTNINYAGHIERMTVADLKKLAGDEFSKDEYRDIEENHTNTSDRENDYYDFQSDGYITDTGDIKKVKVVHFEYLTQNEMVHIEKDDRFGNKRFAKQPYKAYKTQREQEKFKKKYGDSRKLHRTPYTACLSGYYIVGSDYIFKYGIKKNTPRKKGALGNTTLGYNLFAPNMYSGKLVSSLKQMIPVLDDLQEYSLKIQQIVSSAVPKGLEVDLFELSKAKLKGKGGREMSDLEKLEMYFQRGILIRNSEGKYAQGTGTTPVRELENGMARDVVNYLNLIASAKEELDEITGINRAMAGGNLHQDTGKAVAQMQVQSSETAIDYIYDADAYLFNQMVRNLGVLHVQSVKNGKDFKLYEKALGKSSITFLKDSGIDKHDYGFFVRNRPSKEEWERFRNSADIALQQKEISLADYTQIYRMDNLKRAQQYLIFAEKKRQKQLQQQKEADMQMNQQMQMQSNEQAHANAMAVEQAKQQMILLQADEERKTLQLKIQLETEMQLQLEQIRSGAKMEMNERLVQAKEDSDLMKVQSQEDIEVFKNLTQNKNK